MSPQCIAILDIGKTLSKITLWSADRRLIDRATRPSATTIAPGGYPCLDAAGVEDWLRETLAAFSRKGHLSAILPVAHGAAAAILTEDGGYLAPLDYEAVPPDDIRDAYVAQRDAFAVTGSPCLPAGLNLGMQLHWLETMVPQAARGTIVTWPQFWSWRLSGVAATEVTSLGCHTDLWHPAEGCPSPMAQRRGWAQRLAPLHRAGDALGPVNESWRKACNLPEDCLVYCGLHDSNADLLAVRGYPEIGGSDHTVLSTGTWFVAMRSMPHAIGVDLTAISETRDCLVNVDAYGVPVPSARFMGGRELELIEQADQEQLDPLAYADALIQRAAEAVETGAFALPAFQGGVGPFPNAAGRMIDRPKDQIGRRAVGGLYLALMANTALNLIGSRDKLVVEGRFAGDPVFTRALARLRPTQRIYLAPAFNSISYGAMRLIEPDLAPDTALSEVEALPFALGEYAACWRELIA